eukprot:CAMPEP_0194117972 /NCGR_PEP_ID=MMETSP0150-20130528/33605_1 /TAXON_ID=122233 /ORGANISM="Chaetoceros debilis, Strain MM31A-1" /LENGTH=151 /DNA_ID=CAMNT_0038809185 /DNA_START=116 /DNA_END=568 /DNA_ORIENTATION=+
MPSSLLSNHQPLKMNTRMSMLEGVNEHQPSGFADLSYLLASSDFADSTISTRGETAIAIETPISTPTVTAVGDFVPSSIDGGMLSGTTNTIVFIIGIIPFLWATYEFWSRIAVGASFGTGKDSIQIRPSTTIGTDEDRRKSRGQQVLGDDA